MFDLHLIGVTENKKETITNIVTYLMNGLPDDNLSTYSITVTSKELSDMKEES